MGKKHEALKVEHQIALDLIASLKDVVTMLQKPMGTGEYILRIALNHFWNALGAEHQTDACEKLRDLMALSEARGRALSLAVDMLAPNEPGDSRAVSDEFVALASVACGDFSPEVMAVIDAPRNPISFTGPHEIEITMSVS